MVIECREKIEVTQIDPMLEEVKCFFKVVCDKWGALIISENTKKNFEFIFTIKQSVRFEKWL